MRLNRLTRVPILAYHAIVASFTDALPDGWSRPHAVTREAFRSQLEYLRSNAWASVLPGSINHTDEFGRRAFVATFDDGHKSDLWAANELQDCGYRAIFYVPWAHLDKVGFLDRADVRDLLQNGFAVGSHGMTHTPLTGRSDQELKTELTESKKRFEDLTGRSVLDLALPFGRYNSRVIAAAIAAGFERIMSSNLGTARPDQAPPLPRVSVSATTTLNEFATMLTASPFRMTERRLLNGIRRRLGLTA